MSKNRSTERQAMELFRRLPGGHHPEDGSPVPPRHQVASLPLPHEPACGHAAGNELQLNPAPLQCGRRGELLQDLCNQVVSVGKK